MLKPKQISSQSHFRGRVVDMCTDRIRYANGREYDLDMIRHPGAAAVVAIDARQQVCLVRQYRHGIEDFLWEIPAGKLDGKEPPDIAAVRELAEETGVSARRWEPLGLFLPAPGLITERVHLYLARDLTLGTPAPESDEELEMQWIPLEAALRMVVDGTLDDGKTAMALIRAQGRL